jgi:hypothetical protein
VGNVGEAVKKTKVFALKRALKRNKKEKIQTKLTTGGSREK